MTKTLTTAEVARARALIGELLDLLAPEAPAVAAPPAAATSRLPADYRWLEAKGPGLPLTIVEALKEYGTKELAGGANSPVIMGWADEVGLRPKYTSDAIPWCGLFAAVVAKRANKAVPKDPLWALNWAKFGVEVGQPGLGDVLTFTRENGGHVGFYVGEDTEAYHVLGGNQSDAVTITRIAKTRLHRARRPIYRNTPAEVKPVRLASAGALSTNEA
jgi:uncharacterized protein (TIGR02594 family)